MIDAQPRRRRRGCLGMVVGLLLVGVLVVVGVGAAWFFLTRPNPGSGTLTGLQGTVETRDETAASWILAVEGQEVSEGQRVRTGAGSSANLLFFERAVVNLSENTEVGLHEVSSNRRGQAGNVTLFNWAGTTNVRMVPLKDPRSQFTVESPVATTTMSGAEVTIQVEPDGTTIVTPTIGSAVVSSKVAGVSGRVHGLMSLSDAPAQQANTTTVFAGQQAIIDAAGVITVNQLEGLSEEDIRKLFEETISTSDDTWTMTLSEQDINDALASTSELQQYGVSLPTVWLTNGNIILGGQVSGASLGIPLDGPFTMVATPSVDTEGNVRLTVSEANVAGVPLPANIVSEIVSRAESAIRDMVTVPETPVKITSAVVEEGTLTVSGTKLTP